MKKKYCLVVGTMVFFLRLGAAAEGYSAEDYTTFVVMQRIANAHFFLVERVNQQLREEAKTQDKLLCPGAYWFSDQRSTEPDSTKTMSLSQGLLFNLKTRTLYSRFGAWCFASEAMYKLAHSHCVARTPKKNVWDSFNKTLFATFRMALSKRQAPHEEYVVHSFNGTLLPTVIFEEPPFGMPAIEASAPEDVSMFAAPAVPSEPVAQPASSRVNFHELVAFFSRWVGRWRTTYPAVPAGGIHGEMTSVLDIPQGQSTGDQWRMQACARHTHDHERVLAVWREMKRAYDAEGLFKNM